MNGPAIPAACAIALLLAALGVFPGLSVAERVLALVMFVVALGAVLLTIRQRSIR